MAVADTVVRGDVVKITTDAVRGSNDVWLPHTIYSVDVADVYKGRVNVNARIEVVVTGGTIDGEVVSIEGAPVLHRGGEYVFFLHNGRDGRYHPEAGGAAIATQSGRDSFELSPSVTGGPALTFTESEIVDGRADSVTVALKGNGGAATSVVVTGNVQSGGLRLSRSAGRLTGVACSCLIDGHAVTFDLDVSQRDTVGDINLDGVAYQFRFAVVASPSPERTVVTGTATKAGSDMPLVAVITVSDR